ncbi:DUF935 domain-containing protein [Zavarzinia aquatilis]|uniref:DUF935 domain-containing protein n=1 Tax=Zavarzinia aquatilis TaxID=2211142 RepID=A0A317DXH4_9PROT|nr:DUF935 domain-containing protein [Zavarzinia aquatilis]PWR17643.1 DUF935 domain-containing protein [Zavarzinia aquatilis]
MAKSSILDAWGRPFDLQALREEQAGATVTGVRQPVGGHPASGLTPQRLARLLRGAEDGDPVAYLELAEDMEERDLHYGAVLGIRKRQVSGLQITVEAAGDDAQSVADADLVRAFIDRDELADELIDILDAIGKGFSCTEIIWDMSERQWSPARLEWRDPRWFDFDRETRRTPMLIGEGGQLEPLAPGKWVQHMGKAKSGLPIRGGLARPVSWAFMFKSFSIKDWAVFCEVYGQPLRVGKFGPGATEADKDILLRAVRNLGTDAAAIIPDSMIIEFIESKLSGNHDLYEKHADWWDRQISKVVLGQTGTTDAIAGGYAVGKVHDGVRGDLEDADCRQVGATLTRDIARPLVMLNNGPRKAYPRICIGRPDEVDVEKLVKNVATLVPLGLKVGMATMRDRIGVPDPDPDEELLTAPAQASAPPEPAAAPPAAKPPARALASRQEPGRDAVDAAIDEIIAAEGFDLVEPLIAGLEGRIAALPADATLQEAEAILAEQNAAMAPGLLARRLAEAVFAARLAGEGDEPLS